MGGGEQELGLRLLELHEAQGVEHDLALVLAELQRAQDDAPE